MVDEGGDDGSKLIERLYAGAGHHARSANSKFESPERGVRMDAAIHVGAAVELMAKSVLVSVDPRLIVSERASYDALVDVLVERGLLVAGPRGRKPGGRTVDASVAVALASRLAPPMFAHASGAEQALRLRNAAAHAAELNDGQLRECVWKGTAFVLAGVDYLHRSRREFLGPELSLVVEQIAEDVEAAVNARAESKVALATRRYGELLSQFPEGTKDRLLQLFDRQDVVSRTYPAQEHECPACSNSGEIFWDVETDVEYEGPGEFGYYTTLTFHRYRCPYCQLDLDEDEWSALGLSFEVEDFHDFDAVYEE